MSLNYGMFELARGYKERGMAAYSELQQAEFAAKQTVTLQQAINAKSEQDTLMKSHKSLRAELHQQLL